MFPLSDLSDFEGDEEHENSGSPEDEPMFDNNPSSNGPVMSSPVKGTLAEQKEHLRRKATKKRKATIQRQQELASQLAANQLETNIQDVLDLLRERGVRFGEFLKFVFDPSKGQGNIRWQEFFARRGEASQILDWWTSSANSQSGRDEVESWATDYIAKQVAREAKEVTASKILQTKEKIIDQEFVMSFSFNSMHEKLNQFAPISMCIIKALSTSPNAERGHKDRRKERTKTV